ncbi:MAG TPA: alpha/beta fold hydrolase [Gemmatimonadaceae bacterium]|jgi:homoserine O-acetyltransferase/O-succinyltransferase|nr:alpha/beta fold hydrolase [Gemmatimonadaceae bacterium]
MNPLLLLLLVQAANYTTRDVKLADGEVMPELRIHYRTLGPSSGKAVLIMHGTSGSSDQFLLPIFAGQLFGPGQLLDTTKYFVILPDDIGHGGSSKPSDGLHAKFPHYGYADMVEAEYRLVTDGLHVRHLRLVMGTSMGCMHTWMWLERYPTFMDGAVPLACNPAQITGRNRMWRRMAMDDIRNSPDYNGGEYTSQPYGYTPAMQLLSLWATSPLVLQHAGPTRDKADSAEMAIVRSRMEKDDANDLIYQLDASRDYDPSADLERIVAPVLAINSADDAINPPELGTMEPLLKRVERVKFVLLPTTDQTVGHGTHTKAVVWKSYLADFMASLP